MRQYCCFAQLVVYQLCASSPQYSTRDASQMYMWTSSSATTPIRMVSALPHGLQRSLAVEHLGQTSALRGKMAKKTLPLIDPVPTLELGTHQSARRINGGRNSSQMMLVFGCACIFGQHASAACLSLSMPHLWTTTFASLHISSASTRA